MLWHLSQCAYVHVGQHTDEARTNDGEAKMICLAGEVMIAMRQRERESLRGSCCLFVRLLT